MNKSGVDRGVLYFRSNPVSVWNGLSKITEKLAQDVSEGYFDGQKYAVVKTPDAFSATAEALTYPVALDSGDVFDLTYRVMLDVGYELHIVYNARAKLEDASFDDLATPFSIAIETVPIQIDGYRATSHICINSNDVDQTVLGLIETVLYGSISTSPAMLTLAQILAIFEAHATTFVVVDNGDGTWTATGPNSWFEVVDATTMKITSPSIDLIDTEKFLIRSW